MIDEKISAKDLVIPQSLITRIPRKQMPQIASDVVIEFLDSLPVRRKRHKVRLDSLRLTQKEINTTKVIGMMTGAKESSLSKPIIVSNDDHILDGHHRFVALLNKHPDNSIDVYRVDMSIRDLLDAARNFSKVMFKGVREEMKLPDKNSVLVSLDTEFKRQKDIAMKATGVSMVKEAYTLDGKDLDKKLDEGKKDLEFLIKDRNANKKLLYKMGKQGRVAQYDKEIEEVKAQITSMKSQFHHSSYTSAIEAALNYAVANGYETDDDNTFQVIGNSPKKPSAGKTNRLTVELYKKDKLQRKALHIQVYGMESGKYELNVYIS